MSLSVEERPFDNDVGDVSGDNLAEHALQVVDSPHFSTIAFANACEPGEATEATTTTKSAGPALHGFLQLARCDTLEHVMLGELVLQRVLWNPYARPATTLPASQGAPPMPSPTDLRREFAEMLKSCVSGHTSISEYLTWEVEFTTSAEADIDPELAGKAARLSLLGHEYLMDIRPRTDFDLEAEHVLKQLERGSSSVEAAGS